MNELRNKVWDEGFALIPNLFSSGDIAALLRAIDESGVRRSRAGARHAMKIPAVAALARDPRLLEIARIALDHLALPFRATLFDKSPASNWLVVWHQDTALPIRRRREIEGWGPWSEKDGVTYSHAPARALEKVIALRVHLDDSTAENGPLRVLPGTHSRGVLRDEQIHELAETLTPIECLVPRGGVLAMRPLIVHASSKSQAPIPRRVLHIEYAGTLHFDEGLELAIA